MSEHTQGPWRANFAIGGAAYVFGGDRNFALVFNEWQDKANQEANARLIAAAPDLLEALESVMDTIEWPPDSNCSCHISPPCNDCVNYAGLRSAIADAEAAIAKAKGATP